MATRSISWLVIAQFIYHVLVAHISLFNFDALSILVSFLSLLASICFSCHLSIFLHQTTISVILLRIPRNYLELIYHLFLRVYCFLWYLRTTTFVLQPVPRSACRCTLALGNLDWDVVPLVESLISSFLFLFKKSPHLEARSFFFKFSSSIMWCLLLVGRLSSYITCLYLSWSSFLLLCLNNNNGQVFR